MDTHDFWFDLPEQLIAQTPLEKRENSKLLVLNKQSGQISHNHFYNIVNLLNSGDTLVLNNSRVLPARLIGTRNGGGLCEILLLQDKGTDIWECIVRPGKKLKVNARVEFGGGLLVAEIIQVMEDGNRLVRFYYKGIFLEILSELGEMPLPPYIKEKLVDNERYQTVYSKELGSSAAPTAGLHFTPEILEAIKQKGVEILEVTLHVGLGTFRPVKVVTVASHKMHSENYVITSYVADRINKAKSENRRIVAVGTTTCRTLESATDQHGILQAKSGSTDIFIYPGYTFKTVDALLTNFHLPESTLLMLVSALAEKDMIMNAYAQAIKENYRFFSFGDAMLIAD